MSDLTKQYFDKQLGRLATKEDIKKLATKEELGRLATKDDLKDEVADLASMVARRFDEVEKKLDLRAEVDELKIKMGRVWNALNIKN